MTYDEKQWGKKHSVVQDDYFHATTNKNWKKSKNDTELVLKMIKLEFSFVNGIINSK